MKRPLSNRVSSHSAGIPTAPVQVASKKLASKSPKRQIPKAVRKREQKRLGKIVSKQKSLRGLGRASSDAKRFTAKLRKKRIIALVSGGAVGSLLLVVLASLFTPMLAVKTIEVTGVKRLKEASIVNALKSEIGKPLPMISASDVSLALEKFALIESYSLVSLPPNTLRVQITERQPIGILISGGTKYLYDPAAVQLGIAAGSEKLPVIKIDGAPKDSNQFRSAIDVLLALPSGLLDRVFEINALSKDDVSLSLRGASGQKIIWGDQSDSVLKSKVLEALIANQKKSDRVIFDVSSPNAPVVKYGNF